MLNLDKLVFTDAEAETFHRDGYLVIPDLLEHDAVQSLRASFPRIFAGDFDTGVFPDEWHWREGLSLPDVTRHMGNAWKSDLTIARLVLSEAIGRAAATLSGWTGARVGTDTIWWKPPGTKPIAMHQDSSFMDYLDPPQTVTCWVTLDDTARDAGTLEYAPGSHHWPITPIPDQFHRPEDYRATMIAAAEAAGIAPPEPHYIEVPAGSAVFHAGEVWHGSGPNQTAEQMRRSIGIHLVHPEAQFSDRPGGYTYRRYQLTGDPSLNESFFPITWQEDGNRTTWIENYVETGRRELAA